jgi:hypothetical protein
MSGYQMVPLFECLVFNWSLYSFGTHKICIVSTYSLIAIGSHLNLQTGRLEYEPIQKMSAWKNMFNNFQSSLHMYCDHWKRPIVG